MSVSALARRCLQGARSDANADAHPTRRAAHTHALAQGNPKHQEPLTSEQVDRLREAFALFDWDGSGALERAELADMLAARPSSLIGFLLSLALCAPSCSGLQPSRAKRGPGEARFCSASKFS